MKKFISCALTAAMALSMVACGSASSTAAPAASSGAAPAASSAAAPAAGETIKIGVLANTSGDYAMYGNAVKNGVMLYLDEVNAAGGINGKQIEVFSEDDKGDPTQAVTAFTLMKDKDITALIGSVLTGATIAVADETYDINMPQITASATAAGVTMLDPEDENSEIRTNVFRSCFIDPFQGEKMAEYAADKLGAKSAAVIYQTGSDYSEGLKDSFVAKCEELGITVTSQQGYAAGDVNFKAQLTAIASEAPDVIFCPNYYQDDALIVTQAREAGVTATFLGGDGWGSVKDYASAEDLEGCVYCSGYAAGTESVAAFEKAYKDAYSEDVPNMFAPLGYDAAMLMVNALTEAENQGLTAGTDEYKQAVIDAMAATDGAEGVTGSYKFDEYNNPIKSAAIMQLQNGEEVFTELY